MHHSQMHKIHTQPVHMQLFTELSELQNTECASGGHDMSVVILLCALSRCLI